MIVVACERVVFLSSGFDFPHLRSVSASASNKKYRPLIATGSLSALHHAQIMADPLPAQLFELAVPDAANTLGGRADGDEVGPAGQRRRLGGGIRGLPCRDVARLPRPQILPPRLPQRRRHKSS